MAIVNFKCQKCKNIFNYDVGEVKINIKTFRPEFENEIICMNCGELTIDDVLLTELGQSQLTEATMNI